MKAIHNCQCGFEENYNVGNYMLKYNFESNSQQGGINSDEVLSWELYAKVQFWKQFTTSANVSWMVGCWELYAKVQFWKQFTTRKMLNKLKICWELYAKVQFWKQFTTGFAVGFLIVELGIIC